MVLEFWWLSTVLELGSISEERFRQETREKKDKARERILPVLSFCGIKGGWKWRLHFVEKRVACRLILQG